MGRYQELNNFQPDLNNCFFAFSKEQFDEGLAKCNLSITEKIVRAPGGLFGTREGINQMYADYAANDERIKKECTPQEVYTYEFLNHECHYTGDDSEAVEKVEILFGKGSCKGLVKPPYVD